MHQSRRNCAGNFARDAIVRLILRMRAALPRLRERSAKAKAAEYAARWEADYECVEQERDKLAEELSATYPALVPRLVVLLSRIAEFDREVDRVNSTAPTGDNRRLVGCELRARGLDRFTVANPPLGDLLRLPNPRATAEVLYPPPQPNIVALQAAEMARALSSRSMYSPDWHAAREEEHRRVREAEHIRQLSD